MDDNRDLPPGTRRAADQSSAPITRGAVKTADGFFANAPELDGLRCQVQHGGLSPGDKPEAREGILGFGIVEQPGGGVLFVVNLKHADGTGLNAILDPREYLCALNIFMPLAHQAIALMRPTAGEG